MKKTFSTAIGRHTSEYSLEETDDGISVSVPFITETINSNSFDIPEGPKADFIQQFFAEENSTIIRGGIAYNIDDVLLDQVEIPDIITEDVIVA